METTAEGQCMTWQPDVPATPEPPARSAWELIDEEWAEREDAPMCM